MGAGQGVPVDRVEKLKEKMMERVPDGPSKYYLLYPVTLEKGDTAQAINYFIASLTAKSGREWLWIPIVNAVGHAHRFMARPESLDIYRTYAYDEPDSIWEICAKLNPDTGKYVRCLKAIESFCLMAGEPLIDTGDWLMVAGKYRLVGRFKEAMRCYDYALASFKRRPITLNGSSDLYPTLALKGMGKTMLLAGDTTKAVFYLTKAAEHQKNEAGREAAEMLKIIQQKK